MLAMQYEITLPADYDMAVIRRRIAEKGHLLDGFPGLGFKAWLYSMSDDPVLPGGTNRYAPFYLWHDGEGMNAFLGGAGFAALARDFGRPPFRRGRSGRRCRQATCPRRSAPAARSSPSPRTHGWNVGGSARATWPMRP